MRPNGNLTKRLAAADPMPDAEQLDPETAREAEVLLARLLATPVEPDAAQRRHAPWRRWALAVAGVAGMAAVVLIAINLVESDAPGPGGIDQAVAARSIAALTREDSVYHVLQEKRQTGDLRRA